MGIDYGKSVGKSLRFGFNPRRWLPFFVLDFVFFSMFVAVLFYNLSSISSVMTLMKADPSAIGALGGQIVLIGVIFIVWMLVRRQHDFLPADRT